MYIWHLMCEGWVATSECFLAFTIFACAYAVWRKQLKIPFHILYFPLLVYALASTMSAIAAGRDIHMALEGALWGKVLDFPLALAIYGALPHARIWARRAILLFGGSTAFFGLFQYFVLHRRDLEHRITGQAAHVMTFSGLLLPMALVFLVLWLHERKWWLLGCTLLTTLGLLMTYTRSAWLGWIAAVLILFLLTRPLWTFYAAIGLVYFVLLAPIPLFGRLISVFDTTQSSNLDRIRMVEAGVEIIKDYPVFGVGPGNIKEVYPLYRKHDAPRFRIPHLHNNVVQIWAERGILALAAYVLLIALFLRECARGWRGPNRKWAEVGVVVTVALTAAGLFEFNFGDTEVFFLMLDLFALVIAFLPAADAAVANEAVPRLVPVTRP